MKTRRPYRDWRPPAMLAAILLSMVLATGGCTLRAAPSSSLMPVSVTNPIHALSEPAPPSPPPSVAPTPSQPATAPVAVREGRDVTAIGDSIMVDGMPNLRSLLPGIAIDAVAGRQVATGLGIMQSLANRGELRATIVIELGTNGAFTAVQLERFLSFAGGRHVVLLTNHCPYCTWVPPNNELMATGCTAARACTVADWETLAHAHPEWFSRDGVHMPIGGVGGQAFAELISNAIAGRNLASSRNPAAGRLRGAGGL